MRTIGLFLPFLFFNRYSITKPRIYDFHRALRKDNPDTPIGVAGFCWGGKFVTLMAHGTDKTDGGRDLIDAGFTAHPSFLDIPADLDAVTLPYSAALGTSDMNLHGETIEKFKKALQGKMDVEVVEYEGAKHGFAVRGDPNDEKEKKQGMEAEEQAVRFFTKYLV